MKCVIMLLLLCCILLGCSTFANQIGNGLQSGTDVQTEPGFQSPPIVKSDRSYPRLVNYFHMMGTSYENSHVANLEEYLAQWDVIILNPDTAQKRNLSLQSIRAKNPGIKILAWIPFGSSSEHWHWEMNWSMPNLYDFYIKNVRGQDLVPPWGGHMMNPWKNSFGWPKHVLSFIEAHYLDASKPERCYDGIMFDCLWEAAPAWFSQDGTADIDGNRRFSQTDNYKYQQGMVYLLQRLRSDEPNIIITGNGGRPWRSGSPYYRYANGDMAENAFGNEFGQTNSTWRFQWSNYQTCMKEARSPQYFFMIADLRYGRTLDQARTANRLTPDDRRRFRLSITTTLLGDGYFGFDRGDCLHGQLWWFPEYSVDLGAPAPGYTAPKTYRKNIYGRGIYSREFVHGCVIVNPTSREIVVKFTEDYIDASTGAVARIFRIPARDGRILMQVK
jgi:hypothetical protein